MRKFNAVLTALILILFILHSVFGAFLMLGMGSGALKTAAWVAAGLTVLHVIVGVKLTIDTLKVQKKTGAAYFKENRLFWARRISGLAVMVLLVFHFTAFGKTENGVYRLVPFDFIKMWVQILLAAALGTHIISNVRPMLISFGVKGIKEHIGEILFVLAVIILFAAAAFAVYYLRWMA